MSDKDPDLPRYVPVAPTGNGHKVRPDFQTKIIGALILAVFIGAFMWAGGKLDDFGERITRIETKVEERFKASDALTKAQIDRLIDKLDEVNRRLESLEKGGR